MKVRSALGIVVLAAGAALAAAAAAQDRASSPLSQSFTRPPLAGGTQAPALWYYGPSYSLHYDRPPPGAGHPYRPSHFFDPYYGYDYLGQFERGHRFGR